MGYGPERRTGQPIWLQVALCAERRIYGESAHRPSLNRTNAAHCGLQFGALNKIARPQIRNRFSFDKYAEDFGRSVKETCPFILWPYPSRRNHLQKEIISHGKHYINTNVPDHDDMARNIKRTYSVGQI